MNISELNGRSFKKLLNAKTCAFRYHNKNNSGGNFGFEIRGLNGKNYELNGEYKANLENTITTLRFGKVYHPRIQLIRGNYQVTPQQIITMIEKIINSEEIL